VYPGGLKVMPFNKVYKDEGPVPAIEVARSAIAVRMRNMVYFMPVKK
jgi:hypothetical protein